MTDINTYEEDKIKSFLHLNETMGIILKTTKDKDKILSALKSQLIFTQSLLFDLGIKSNDLEKIKKLNQKIRDMEANFNSKDINDSKISTYIKNKNEDFKKYLEEYGLSFSSALTFNPEIKIEIKIYSVENSSKKLPILNKELSLLNSEGDNYIIYSEENIIKFENIINNYFKTQLDITYNIKSMIDSDRKLNAVINNISIYIPVSESSKAINEAFKDR